MHDSRLVVEAVGAPHPSRTGSHGARVTAPLAAASLAQLEPPDAFLDFHVRVPDAPA